jgi:hypothetical protein
MSHVAGKRWLRNENRKSGEGNAFVTLFEPNNGKLAAAAADNGLTNFPAVFHFLNSKQLTN